MGWGSSGATKPCGKIDAPANHSAVKLLMCRSICILG